MREIIAALQVSVDGFIEGPGGAIDWIEAWEDRFEVMPDVDTLVLGGRMYPGYEEYWSAVQVDPKGILPFTGRTTAAAARWQQLDSNQIGPFDQLLAKK